MLWEKRSRRHELAQKSAKRAHLSFLPKMLKILVCEVHLIILREVTFTSHLTPWFVPLLKTMSLCRSFSHFTSTIPLLTFIFVRTKFWQQNMVTFHAIQFNIVTIDTLNSLTSLCNVHKTFTRRLTCAEPGFIIPLLPNRTVTFCHNDPILKNNTEAMSPPWISKRTEILTGMV